MNTDSGKTVKVFTMRSESVFMIGQNMHFEQIYSKIVDMWVVFDTSGPSQEFCK